MSNLSGFEIRANLLNQAQGIIEGNLARANESIVIHNDNYPNDKKESMLKLNIEAPIAVISFLDSFISRISANSNNALSLSASFSPSCATCFIPVRTKSSLIPTSYKIQAF